MLKNKPKHQDQPSSDLRRARQRPGERGRRPARLCARRSAPRPATSFLSAERNVVMLRSTTMLNDDFWLEREEDDSDDVVDPFILCDGNVLAIPETEMVEDEDEDAVLEDDDGEAVGSEDEEDEEMLQGTEYEWTDQEDSDADDDDTDEEEDEKSEVSGFMRVAAADEENQEGGGDSQILVLYRYTRFSAARSDGSMESRGTTREHQLRFVAAAGHGARSLAWAGASLAPLIYPDGCCKKLRALWTSLASEVSIPPGAARVKVLVEVGILRPANCTQASKEHMRAALKDMMADPWPERFVGMKLNLPEPMRCGHDEDDNDTDGEQRPAKRRRVVAVGENCSVCFDQLEGDDIAAWPGCGKPHVFHGRCLELIIESKSDPVCPICRRGLYIEPKF